MKIIDISILITISISVIFSGCGTEEREEVVSDSNVKSSLSIAYGYYGANKDLGSDKTIRITWNKATTIESALYLTSDVDTSLYQSLQTEYSTPHYHYTIDKASNPDVYIINCEPAIWTSDWVKYSCLREGIFLSEQDKSIDNSFVITYTGSNRIYDSNQNNTGTETIGWLSYENIENTTLDSNISDDKNSVDNNISYSDNLGLVTDIQNTSFRDTLINGDYIYASTRSGELITYNISTLENKEIPINTLILDDSDFATTGKIIKIDNNTIYIQGNKLFIVDISNSQKPSIVKSLDYSAKWLGATISNSFMLLNSQYSENNTAYLFDVSTADNPILLETYPALGNSILINQEIYSLDIDEKIKKYSLNTSTYKIELSQESNESISKTPYHMYVYNDKLLIALEDWTNGNEIRIYDANTMELLKKYNNVASVRSGGEKDNIVIIGSQIYDLNVIEEATTSLNKYASTSDGFPYGLTIDFNGNIFISSQSNVKFDTIDLTLY
jgi:hypothetical protein